MKDIGLFFMAIGSIMIGVVLLIAYLPIVLIAFAVIGIVMLFLIAISGLAAVVDLIAAIATKVKSQPKG